jgi:hypothetical protein
MTMHDGTSIRDGQSSPATSFVGELWERVHAEDLVVSVTEIAPRRFQVAAFYRNGQQWAESMPETAADARRVGDDWVRHLLGHTCSAACRDWALNDVAAADWLDAAEAQQS